MTEIKVLKRNGSKVEYDGSRIILAITKAMLEAKPILSDEDRDIIENIESDIYDVISENEDIEYSVELIQDMIENKLMEYNEFETAKKFILYRNERTTLRKKGWEMTELQKDIFKNKYEYNDEGFDGFLDRVGGNNERIKKFIKDKKFLPAGRILAGRGLYKDGVKTTYSNCYVLSTPEDNIESIFETAKKLARTFSYGGGCGLDISKLRPRGTKVNNSAKYTTGAVSFMDLYSLVTELIGQNNRRGALMISIDCSHPDLEEFIDIKNDLDKVTKANISIKLTDEFMQAVKNNEKYNLRFTVETTNETIEKKVNAREIFRKLAKSNWNSAEPGCLFWDKINNWNLMSEDKDFAYASVNPCAEEPLPSGGSCLLSSINLSEFVKNPFTKEARFDYEGFKEVVREGVIYLNEILDEGLSLHPLQEQKDTVRDLRQIGLGVMGIADMLIKLGLKYGSNESLDICDDIGFLMADTAIMQSALLAKDYGVFPKYKEDCILNSPYFIKNTTTATKLLVKKYGLRNSQLLTIAPTGSISTMLGVSGGIEPIFMISYTRKTETLHDGDTYYKVYTPIAKDYMEINNIKTEEELPDFFVTAMTLDYKDRINMQAVWQKHIDASISSTVNVPNNFTIEETEKLYMYAWEQNLKGITIYRDGCARTGILTANKPTNKKKTVEELQEELNEAIVEALKNNPNECPMCGGEMFHSGGCSECRDCGYSPCAV